MVRRDAAFIDSQNRANTFVNYAGVKNVVGPRGENKKRRKIGGSGNMTWHRSHRSIGGEEGRDGRTVASTTARLVLRFGRRSFFGDIAKYFNRTGAGTCAHTDPFM